MTLEIDIDRNCEPGEAQAARALVAAILADPAGYLVSTQDGETWNVIRSRDEAQILASLGSTEEDRIAVILPDRRKVGTFWLLYGNASDGSELVADYGWTDNVPDAESIMRNFADVIPDEGF